MAGRPRWVRWVLAGALLALAAAGAVGGYVYHYVRKDPTFCTSCHRMGELWSEWQRSPHAKINCHTCHPGDVLGNIQQLVSGGNVVPHGGLDQKACETCHYQGDRWPRVKETVGHKVHVDRAAIACVRCHAKGEHIRRPAAETCGECHRGVTVTLDKMAKTHCVSCHNFLAAGGAMAPSRETCLRCHARHKGPDLELGMHNRPPCHTCHRPHAKRAPGEGPVLAADCAKCHAGPVAQTAKVVAVAAGTAEPPGTPPQRSFGQSHGSCKTCHSPHGARGQGRTRCAGCHEHQSPRIPTAGHKDCAACHAPHDWTSRPDAGICATCHAAIAAGAPQRTAAHRACRSCHTPHLAATARSRCPDCHAPVVAAVGHEARPHAECTVCHKPHRPPNEGTKACADCHGDRVHGTAAHARCTQCHTPHALGKRKAADRCSSCHVKVAKRVTETPHETCATCHTPHPPGGDMKKGVKACVTCHAGKAPVLAGVHRTCTQCHEPHGVDQARARTACADCHERPTELVQKDGAPHKNCLGCHAPHDARPAMTPKGCPSCHARQARRALAKGGAHAGCSNCHAPHRPAFDGDGTCARCHGAIRKVVAAVSSPAPHGRCSSCHAQHALRPTGSAACRSCHADKAAAAAGFAERHPAAAGIHGRCTACHEGHGSPRSRKTCDGCHPASRRQGNLHASAGHAECGACHATHAPTVSGRGVCLSCHTDRKDHVPAAKECKGCHQFR